MPHALYVVIHSQHRWWVDFEGQAHGPYASIEEATDEGRRLARFMASSGKPSELLVPDEQGRYSVAWNSESEPRTSAA
jgi:hypothetical protein